MCGIFSLFNMILNDAQLKEIYKSFMLGHERGPEFSSLEKVNQKAYIGFHRLAINGINTKSNQPIYCNGITLICNGEIYNYKELIQELNITMTTDSDCEIIIHLYLKYGFEQMIQMLDGVFAFVLMDLNQPKHTLYVARDPFGVRPLFEYEMDTARFGFSSEIKMIHGLNTEDDTYCHIRPFQPGTWNSYTYCDEEGWKKVSTQRYFTLSISPFIDSVYTAQNIIRKTFTDAIRKRVDNTDRPIACLLSGGLDSSLVCALVSKFYSQEHRTLETYSIGMEGSIDLKYARIVANHIGSKHTEIIVKEQDFLDAIPEVIHAIESFDTTTVRASVGNYLVSKYISKHSNAKVIFNGDGSDEVCGGYMYFHYAPDCYHFDAECKRLLQDIHYFDVLRSDRSISSNGLEARTPFLDKIFVQHYMSILPRIRCHKTNGKCEKWLLRSTFYDDDLLPNEVLWRTKEAFSDGVSSQHKSWYEMIQDHVQQNQLGSNMPPLFHSNHMCPLTEEQMYYRKVFHSFFGKYHAKVIPYFWMPKFVKNATDASARTLDVYQQQMSIPIEEAEETVES